jgi:uncharacterized phage-associated protein
MAALLPVALTQQTLRLSIDGTFFIGAARKLRIWLSKIGNPIRGHLQGRNMASVYDVAQHILDKTGPISTWKLQKLVYYAQAWSSVWLDRALFPSRIEAWANGPVCRELYDRHRGQFIIQAIDGGSAKNLPQDEIEAIDKVVDFYGRYNGQQLSDFTHSERPWIAAREGLSSGERCEREITLESMSEYYSSL